VCLALFLALPSQAQQSPIVADRPGLADGAGVVGRGTAQLELGISHEGADDSLLTLPTLLRLGITDRFELRVESGVLGLSSGDHDWVPVAVGFKWRMRDGDIPLSLIASIQPPSGGGPFTSYDFEGGVRLVSDIDLGSGFSLTPNLGVGLAEGGGTTAVVAASLGREVGNASPFIDFEVQNDQDETSMIVDGGIAWIVRQDTQLDVSAGVNVSGAAYPDWFVSAGVSRRF
jgi:hypothetical protein